MKSRKRLNKRRKGRKTERGSARKKRKRDNQEKEERKKGSQEGHPMWTHRHFRRPLDNNRDGRPSFLS